MSRQRRFPRLFSYLFVSSREAEASAARKQREADALKARAMATYMMWT